MGWGEREGWGMGGVAERDGDEGQKWIYRKFKTIFIQINNFKEKIKEN